MVASVPADTLRGARILEIGGGIGTVQAELLTAGAASGEIVELLPAYAPYARELARDKAIEDRSVFHVADVLEHPEAVSPADIVVLNRVVCCSPDGVRLTGTAARLAGRMLLISHPRDRFVIRVVGRVMNTIFRIMGKSFRLFLHQRESLHAAAEGEGLVVAETGRDMIWEFAALRRKP